MPSHACQVCGRISKGKRCPEHQRTDQRKTWSPKRDRGKQAKFRREVLERDGHQCTVAVDGVRCPVTEGLRAAHYPKPLRDFAESDPAAYDPASGITVCPEHDRALDPHAR